MERGLPDGWVNKISPFSLFWAFCVGTHGSAGTIKLGISHASLDFFILEHTLTGRMHVFRIDIFELLSQALSNPVTRYVTWLGHADKISKLGRTVDGRGLLSKGHAGDSIAWELCHDGKLRQRGVLPFQEVCYSVTFLGGNIASSE
jgi:hypothetical protein